MLWGCILLLLHLAYAALKSGKASMQNFSFDKRRLQYLNAIAAQRPAPPVIEVGAKNDTEKPIEKFCVQHQQNNCPCKRTNH